MTTRFLIYGANGHVGEAAARLAPAQDLHPILAGRNPASLELLARALGVEFPGPVRSTMRRPWTVR